MNIPEFSNNSFQDPQQANESNDKAKNPKVVMGRKRAAGMTKPVGSNEKTVVDEVNKISSKIHNDDLSVTPHTSNKIQELKPKQTPRKEEIESDDEEIITVVEQKIGKIIKGEAKEEKKDLSSMSPYEIMNKEIKKIFSAELSNVGKGRINVEKLVKICNLYVSASELIDILYEINASSKTLPEVKQVYNFLLECIKLPYFKNDFLEVETNKKLVFLYNSIKENNSTKLNNNIKIEDLENLFTSQLDITEYKEIADNEDKDKYISDNLSSIISNKCYGMGIKDIMNENNKYVDVMNSIKCYFLNIILSGKNKSDDLRTLSNIGSHSKANHDYATAKLTDLLTFNKKDSNNKKFFYEYIDTLIAEKKVLYCH